VPKLLRALRENIRHREILLLSMVVAVVLLQTPLQHYMTLSRFQHYAIGVFAVATGFLLQMVIAWRGLSLWGRLAMLASALYLGAFGLVCYQNPWLDVSFDMQTALQEEMRPRFAVAFLCAGFGVSFFWANWFYETARKAKPDALKPLAETAEERVS
jgi:hypothetical protein